MKIFLDLSKTKCGIYVEYLNESWDTSKLKISKKDLEEAYPLKSMNWRVMRDEVIEYLREREKIGHIELVVIEVSAFSNNKWTSQALNQVISSVFTYCELNGIKTATIMATALSFWKRAKLRELDILNPQDIKVKEAGLIIVKRFLNIELNDDDIADAICLALYYKENKDKLQETGRII